MPYKYTKTPSGSSKGLGDITLGIGPRFTINNYHIFGYAALTFPTGDHESKPQLGTGRHDIKLGGLATILSNDKSLEIDWVTEYNITENTSTGIPNEVYFGLVGGGKLTKKTRAVIGLTNMIKDKDFMLNLRAIGRYTISKKLHFELIGDKTLAHNNIPSITNISLYTRYNF
ncbi:transporter [Candidatus Pacearchaeota archaeon]|nr:transporter [Candidatus Pacearchaeota archaeon]